MQKIIQYTYGEITVQMFLETWAKYETQKTSDIPYITEIDYSPITKIMKVVQIENAD